MAKLFPFIFFILSFSLQSQIITLTTTSKSSVWSPNKVIKTGSPLIWKASATGMTDQIDTGIPTFDLSVPRTSPVTITATSSDGSIGFTELGINSLNLTSLNITNADFLTSLSCTDNQLTSLDISNNKLLNELFCHTNQLSNLDLTNNKQLSILACFSNSISILDISQNTLISTLSCSFNIIKALDLSLNNMLISLECDNNQLTSLNIQNGNNTNMNIFNSTKNISLTCIQVDDETADHSKWNIDSWTIFNNDCTFSNRPPIAIDDFYDTTDNTVLNINANRGVLVNDTDYEKQPLTSILESDVNNGSLSLNSDGSFIYTPNQNYYGVDSFTYKANDGELNSNIAKVTIDVLLANKPPITNENFYTTIENTVLSIDESEGVLSNDNDSDRDFLTAHLESDINNGVLNFSLDGSFIYSPNTNFFGEDIFTYKAFDGFEYSSITKVKIKVEAIVDIIIPNAFSPNNDMINDTFRPVFKGMSTVRLVIYDTWGNLIYFEEGQDLKGWDGKIKGKDAENGNYLYIVTATTLDEQTVVYDGKLTLIK